MNRPRRSLQHIFLVPLVIGIASFTGLVLALLMDGGAELIAVFAVGCPIAVLAWAFRRRF